MHIRWRGLELPSQVQKETLTPTYGKFVAEPFERGLALRSVIAYVEFFFRALKVARLPRFVFKGHSMSSLRLKESLKMPPISY